MKKLNKKGFTIVELVIVIAVIAILSAVLIPTFSSIIKKAEKSNIDQAAKNVSTEMLAVVDQENWDDMTIVYIDGKTCYEYKIVNGEFKQVDRALAIDANDKIYGKDEYTADDALKTALNGTDLGLVSATVDADNYTQMENLAAKVWVVVSVA